jgi:trehalose-6-phosphate synthase
MTGSTITNLYFHDEIDALNWTSTADGMDISAEEFIVMTNNINGIGIDSCMKLVHIF